jgi:hypothetical protein
MIAEDGLLDAVNTSTRTILAYYVDIRRASDGNIGDINVATIITCQVDGFFCFLSDDK